MSTMYWILTALSLISTKLNIDSAISTIELKGYKIDFYNLDIYSRINAFLRDYLFAFVPIYHVYKAFYVDRFQTPYDVYVQNRMKFYDDLGILREADEKELRKKEAKEAKLKKINDMAEEEYEKAHKEVSDKIIEKITGKTSDELLGEKDVEEPLQIETKIPVGLSSLESKKKELAYREALINARIKQYKKAEEEMLLPYKERLAMYNKIMDEKARYEKLFLDVEEMEKSQNDDLSDVLSNKKEEGQALRLK